MCTMKEFEPTNRMLSADTQNAELDLSDSLRENNKPGFCWLVQVLRKVSTSRHLFVCLQQLPTFQSQQREREKCEISLQVHGSLLLLLLRTQSGSER